MNAFFKRLSVMTGFVLVFFFLLGVLPASANDNGIIDTFSPTMPSTKASKESSSATETLASDSQDASENLIHTFSLVPWERANSVAFSPDSGSLVVGTSLGIHVYQLQTFEELRSIRTDEWVRGIAVSPDGTILAGALFDGTIRLWRVSDGWELARLESSMAWARSVAFSPDGMMLASISDDNALRLWRVSDGALLSAINENTQGIRAAVFSPDGSVLASGLADGSINLWRVEDGALVRSLKGHTGWIRALAFSHDGSMLASGAFDATARLWRVSDGAPLFELKRHTSSVLSVAFSSDDKVLATGSVDKTLRLWGTADGQLRTVMAGHTGFIFGIAISPDGALLASGSADGTVRLWDLAKPGISPDSYSEAEGGDCRACHHPRGTTLAPAVLEVRCEACHPGGAVLNWCPMFPRLAKPPFSGTGYTTASNRSGVPLPSRDLSVVIASPGNGETFYVNREFTAPIHVKGRAQQLNADFSPLHVTLEAWSGENYLGKLQAPVPPDGGFTFDLRINPDGIFPVRSSEQIDAGSIICDTCHTRYEADLDVPQGEIHLVVTVESEEGEQARDERWVTVDVSQADLLEVRLVDDVSGEPVSGAIVRASTRLYEWRARTTAAVTGEDGIAVLNPEVLREAATIYSVLVPGQVVDGVYYEAAAPAEITYPPNRPARQSIEIRVRSQTGAIAGTIDTAGNTSPEPTWVWAVQLPAGPAYQAETVQGTFALKGVPVGKYLLFSDGENTRVVDLGKSPRQDVILRSSQPMGDLLEGAAMDRTGGWLPFAWLTLPRGQARPVDLAEGRWTVHLAGSSPRTMVLTAPGYYSRVIALQQASNDVNVSLNRRPDMRRLAWGSGEILLPQETKAMLQDDVLQVESGWVWGSNGTSTDLSIDIPQAEIHLDAGKFALSHLPGQITWFYLLDGAAHVHSDQLNETINVGAGSMVGLEENGKISAMPYEAAVYAALNRVGEAPVSIVWEPSLSARLQKRLIEAGLTAAQVVTYVTYGLVFISITAIPIAALSSRIGRKDRIRKMDQHAQK